MSQPEPGMKWIYDDGGRAAAGYKGETGDCAARSIAIVTGLDYQVVYDLINEIAMSERRSKRERRPSNARTGVHRRTVDKLFATLGWVWTPTMHIGQGTTTHLRDGELPSTGRLFVRCSKHFTAVVDGIIHDTHDPSRDGTRCVYGYWSASSVGEPG